MKYAYNIRGARKTRPVRKDDTKAEIRKYAISPLLHIQADCTSKFYTRNVLLEVRLPRLGRADTDNVFKGIADAIQGLAYANDKQIKAGLFTQDGYHDKLSLKD